MTGRATCMVRRCSREPQMQMQWISRVKTEMQSETQTETQAETRANSQLTPPLAIQIERTKRLRS